MKIGLQITDFNWKNSPANIGENLTEIAKTADESGFYSLWLADHLLNAMNVFGLPVEAPQLEGYSTISYLAALTRQIKLGLLVTCNFFIGSPLKELPAPFKSRYEDRLDFLRQKLAILEQHCNAVRRPYDDIEKTVQTYVKLAPDAQNTNEVVDLCRELADLGFQHVIFNMPNVHEIKPLEILGNEVIPTVAEL